MALRPGGATRTSRAVEGQEYLALRQNSWVNSDGNAGNPVGGCDQEKEGG